MSDAKGYEKLLRDIRYAQGETYFALRDGILAGVQELQSQLTAAQAALTKAREVAEWHAGDGDECGILARTVIAEIDSALVRGAEKSNGGIP